MRTQLIASTTLSIICGFFAGIFFVELYPKHAIFAISYTAGGLVLFALVNCLDARERFKQLKLLTDIAAGRDNTGRGVFSLGKWIRDARALLGLPPIEDIPPSRRIQ
jgi:hypothetical protein